MSFTFASTAKLPEVIVIEGQRFSDDRGFFSESFRVDEFVKNGIPPFVQENHSRSSTPCIRGLHYQLNPKAQGKLVYCVSGRIVDVAVDIRKGSPTYGDWVTIDLSEDDIKMVYIPPGFAHGFLAYGMAEAHVIYKVTEYYSSKDDRCIVWNDPDIDLKWGKHIFFTPKVSDKDAKAPSLKDADNNFQY